MSNRGKVCEDKRCNRFYIDIYWKGKRYHIYKYMGVMPCRSRDDAESLRIILNDEINKGVFNPDRHKKASPLHLEAYSEIWLETLDVSEATLHDYKNSLKNHILPALGKEFLPDITTDMLKIFQKGIKREPKGKKNVMDCLKMIMKAAQVSNHIAYVPEWPKLKVKKPNIRWITQADQWLILDNIPIEDRHIFIFMTLTGCRPSEARAFRKVDIRKDHIIFAKTFGRGEILKDVKGFNEAPFPLHDALKQLLDDTPKNLTPFVFINPRTGRPYTKNINRIWNKACDNAKVKRVNLNQATRHSFACQTLNSGVDKSVVQKLLRHTDSKMTDRYAEYLTNTLKITLDNVFDVDRRQTVGLAKGGIPSN